MFIYPLITHTDKRLEFFSVEKKLFFITTKTIHIVIHVTLHEYELQTITHTIIITEKQTHS